MITKFILKSKEELIDWATKEFGDNAIVEQSKAYESSLRRIEKYGYVIIVKKPNAQRAHGHQPLNDNLFGNQIPQSTH